MAAQTFEQIMADIDAGLTGDPQADIKWLASQAEAYGRGPFGQEVARECGRRMYGLLSQEQKDEVAAAMDKDNAWWRDAIDAFEKAYRAGDFQTAHEAIAPAAQKALECEEGGICHEDTQSVYYDLNGPMEELLLNSELHPEKQVRAPILPFTRLYFSMGAALYELGQFDQAALWHGRALAWDPAFVMARLELAEDLKRTGDFHGAKETAFGALPYCWQPAELAKVYRQLGYCETELGNVELAAAWFVCSLGYERSEIAASELAYIKMAHGEDYTRMKPAEAVRAVEEAGHFFGPADNVTTALRGMAEDAAEEGDLETAAFFADALGRVTLDDRLVQLAAELRELHEQ